MAAQIGNLVLSGTTTESTGHRFQGAHIGTSAAGFSKATGAGSFGVSVQIELASSVRLQGNVSSIGSRNWVLATSNATALRFMDGSSETFKFNTLSSHIRISWPIYTLSGITNGVGTSGGLKQAETYAFTLSANSGNGGVFSFLNPFQAAAFVKTTWLHISGGTADSGGINIGIGDSAGSAGDDIMDGKSISAAGLFNSQDSGGAEGGVGVLLGASQYITGTASGSPSGLDGYVYVEIQERL